MATSSCHPATTLPWATTGWTASTAAYWGFVPRENIVGRPLFVYWSFITPEETKIATGMGDRVQQIGRVLVHFFDQTRWRRTLHMVR